MFIPALLFVLSCAGGNGVHTAETDTHADHVHTEADHDHDHDHDHEEEAHNHDGHTHEGDDHVHEGDDHDHDGHTHGPNDTHEEDDDHKGIVFNPVMAEKLGFEMSKAVVKPISEVVRTSGQIVPAQGDESVVSASASGIVSFTARRLADGVAVTKGETLMVITSDDMSSDNYPELYRSARAAYEKAEGDYKRAEELAVDNIVSAKELAAVKADYLQAKARMETLARNITAKGKRVVAPIGGYIASIQVREGEYVASGAPLMTVSRNRRLQLRADVAQRDFAELGGASSARFVTPYDGRTHDISAMGGRLLAGGRSTDGGFFVPVTFEFDNDGSLIPGAYVDVYLTGSEKRDALTVPVSSLVEEQGTYSVFIKIGPDEFEKIYVKPGVSDGMDVEITAGLEEGAEVVSKGAYYVKLAGVSSSVPAHNHSH